MIDFHYHFSSYSFNYWSPPNTIDNILEEMDRFCIEKRLIFPYFNPDGYIQSHANKEIIAACKRSADRLIPILRAGFLVNYPYELRMKLKTLREEYPHSFFLTDFMGAVRHLRSKVSKSLPVNDFVFPQFEYLIQNSFPALKFSAEENGSLSPKIYSFIQKKFRLLIIHINPFELDFLLSISGMSEGFTIILAHMGSFGMVTRQFDKAVNLTNRYPGLYVDISGIYAKNILEHYLPLFENKIVFGSDGPCFSTQVALNLLREINAFEIVKDNSIHLARKLSLI